VGELPVIGVPYDGAEAYAAAHGKRLPTPYEWCMAAFGSDGDQSIEWASRYLDQRQKVWDRAVLLHFEYLRDHPNLQRDGVFTPSLTVIPWIAGSPAGQAAAEWSKQVCEQLTEPLWSTWHDPMYLLPVGSRDFDTSPCGAQDMVLNASELVVSSPCNPTRGQPRFMEVVWAVHKPRKDDLWLPRDIGNEAVDIPYLPPLSRLFRRALISPSTRDLLTMESVNELDRMLMPLNGWYVRMSPDMERDISGFLVRPQGNTSFYYIGPSESLYKSAPAHFRPEMGLPVPVDYTDQHVSTGPQLYFVEPTGFRCAR
jgi:hypothetical protein